MSASRRDFLKVTAASTFALAAAPMALKAAEQAGGGQGGGAAPVSMRQDSVFTTPESKREGDMLFRTMGKTGEKVSLVGLGGFHLGSVKPDDAAIKLCRRAIDAGVNFMDNCWDYHDGHSEVVMGKALQDGYRKKVFLMTKLDGRTKASTLKQLEESLKRLQTDVIDLCQVHEIIRMEDPDRCFAKDGAMEGYIEAKKAGKIRYIGFTGHKDPIVHLRMLQAAKEHGFHFDAVQMPLNPMDMHFRSFANDVLPALLRDGIGVLAMKTMGGGRILKSNTVSAVECLHFAMNLPTSTVITGIESDKILDQALEAVKTFKPLTKEQVAQIVEKARPAAAKGEFELFKTSDVFDGTAKNPHWLTKPT